VTLTKHVGFEIRCSKKVDRVSARRSFVADLQSALFLYGKRIVSYGRSLLRRVALVRTDVSEGLSASFIRVTRIGELGTTLGVTSNRRTLRRNTDSCHPDEGGAKSLRNVGSYKNHTA
jgi:hypothetical protein